MKHSEFNLEVKRRKSEITRRTNKVKKGNLLLLAKVEEYRKIKVLKNELLDFRSRFYSVVNEFDL